MMLKLQNLVKIQINDIDFEHYKKMYPDLQKGNVDVKMHYLSSGLFENRIITYKRKSAQNVKWNTFVNLIFDTISIPTHENFKKNYEESLSVLSENELLRLRRRFLELLKEFNLNRENTRKYVHILKMLGKEKLSNAPSASALPSTFTFNDQQKNVKCISVNGTSGYSTYLNNLIDYVLIPNNYNVSLSSICDFRPVNDDITQIKRNKLYENVYENYDMTIHCYVPTDDFINVILYKFLYRCPQVLMSIWEFEEFPEKWETNLSLFDIITFPSHWNLKTFVKFNEKYPSIVIKQLNYVTPPSPSLSLPSSSDGAGGVIAKLRRYKETGKYYIFYTIGEWNERKNIDQLIDIYLQTFSSNSNNKLLKLKSTSPPLFPLLFIKTFISFDNIDDQNIVRYIENKLRNTNVEILICVERLKEEDIQNIHKICDCYVSLPKSEGLGIGIFEALRFGKNIITTDYSGHAEYLRSFHDKYVYDEKIDLIPVTLSQVNMCNTAVFNHDDNCTDEYCQYFPNYSKKNKWASVKNTEDVKKALKKRLNTSTSSPTSASTSSYICPISTSEYVYEQLKHI